MKTILPISSLLVAMCIFTGSLEAAQTLLSVTNGGGGISLIKSSNAPVPSFKGLVAGSGVTLTDGTNVTITASGGTTNGFTGTNIFKGILPLTQKTRILIEGDSLSDGYQHAGNVTWSTYLTNGFFPTSLLTLATNGSLASRSLATMVANFPTFFIPQITAPSTGTNTLMFIPGGNIDVFTGTSATTIKSYLTNLWQMSKSNGAYTVAFTVSDRSTGTAAQQAVRDNVNNFIRTNAGLWDYLIDWDLLIPNDAKTPPGSLDLYTYRDDDVHFSTNADRIIAGHISQVLSFAPTSQPLLALDRSGNFTSLNVTGAIRQGVPQLLSYNGSIFNCDLSLGNSFYGTLTKATVLTFSGVPGAISNSQTVMVELKQDAVGTWPLTTLLTNAVVGGGTTNIANNTNANQITDVAAKVSHHTNFQMRLFSSTNTF